MDYLFDKNQSDFSQILSFLWNGHNKIWDQSIDKTMINPNQTKTIIWNWEMLKPTTVISSQQYSLLKLTWILFLEETEVDFLMLNNQESFLLWQICFYHSHLTGLHSATACIKIHLISK